MNNKSLILTVMFVLVGLTSMAQQTIRGKVTDAKTGEPIFNALIKVDEKGKGRTDFDGFYSVDVPQGDHVLEFSEANGGYKPKKYEITVGSGGVQELNITLSTTVQQIIAAKVTHIKTTNGAADEQAADKIREEGNSATEEISTAQIKKTGASNGVQIVQQAPGVSIEDGKNVYIRGLGDRYTKTILNGMDIPGLDPDRNSVQLDIFPSVIIDNVTIYKTFKPNLTGDFTGGMVNIRTKDFPVRKTFYVKGGLGYNTNATFNPDFITYDGGALDFLGFDIGARKLPFDSRLKVMNPADSQQDPGEIGTYDATSQFSKTMAARKGLSFLNQRYAVSFGNQFELQKDKRDKLRKTDSTVNRLMYGYNTAFNYRSTNTYFKDVEYNEYLRDTDSSVNELFRDRTSRGEQTQTDVLWTALFGQSLKWGTNKVSLVLFHTQNGTSSAAQLTETNYDSNQAVLIKEGLQYSQRSISNANLSGLHFLDKKRKLKMTWNATPTYSRISDPDIRSTTLEQEKLSDGTIQYLWEESVGADIRRIFRTLNEFNVSAKADFEYTFKKKSDSTLKHKISFGGLNTYKTRSFDVAEYTFRLYNMSTVVPNNPDWFFEEANLYTAERDSGVYAVGQLEPANLYDARQNISALYAMHDFPVTPSFDVTYGARVERNVNRYTGQDNGGIVVYNDEIVANNINVLPSVNAVYKVRKLKDTLTITNTPEKLASYQKKYDKKLGAYAEKLADLDAKRKEKMEELKDEKDIKKAESKFARMQENIESDQARYEVKVKNKHWLDSLYYMERNKRSTNFRGAYSQTLARPSFREISISQIYDPIQGRRYLGNIDLKPTLVHNADLRFEHFFGRTEIVSFSGFYKKFINPIEVVANVAAPNEFKPVNAGEAEVYGAEVEFRKAIGFNRPDNMHNRLVVGSNFTYVVSRVDMNKVQTIIGQDTLTEKQVRENNARVGEKIGDYRTMYGQSPYIVNAFITYSNDSLGLTCNATYNVQGKKLAVIGVGGVPDVFEQPFHSLSVKISKSFGKVHTDEDAPRWSASVRAQNILNNARRRYYEAYNAESQVFDYLHQGMSFTGSISYTIR